MIIEGFAPPDNASLDPPVATDMRVEEDEASADGNSSTEGLHKGYFPRNDNLRDVPITPV